MDNFTKRRKKKRLKNQLIIALLIAVAFGSVIGFMLPTDLLTLTVSGNDAAASIEEASGKAQVIDGDTIRINATTIRLFGIDAPEAKQTCLDANGKGWDCGSKSSALLTSLVDNKFIRCFRKDVDQYGRIVAVCKDGQVDINALMVSNGLAVAYRDYSTDYIDEEEQAKSASEGMWIGKFEYPWNWRGINRYLTSDVVPNGCNIKGNIGSKGSKIYHVPGGEYYSVTQINPSRGEKWFCSEKEARLAGWRRSKV